MSRHYLYFKELVINSLKNLKQHKRRSLLTALGIIIGVSSVITIVTERTAEIGLRKAVGATFHDIMEQFLVESTLITILGGVVGIGLGLLMSYAISLVAVSFGLEWEFTVPFRAYVVSMLFSLVFGVLFGLYPARQAARLDPIEALRNE